MSEPNSRDARRGLPSDAPAPSPEADDKYAVPRFALGRPKTVYSDTTPTDRPAARPKAAPAPSPRARTGSRRSHRSDTDRRFKNSLALTAASTVVPGSGMLGAPLRRTKAIGAVLALAFLAVIAYLLLRVLPNWRSYASLAINRGFLSMVIVGAIFFGLLWVATITVTHLVTRPRGLRTTQRLIAAGVVAALCSVVAVPSALAARYSYDTIKALGIFNKSDDIKADSRPTLDAEAHNPWEGHPRLNILLLGSDNDKKRDYNNTGLGIRTDSIIVASIDTSTGKTTLIQIPRQTPYAPFPDGSVLDQQFPDGFLRWDGADAAQLNNLWSWSEQNSDLFPGATYPGAEGLKLGIEGITGLDIDYFMLLDIDGFKELVDAMGGVTVNINQRLNIGGDTQGRPPTGYLEQGPNQHLDGHDALWYGRSRSNTDDYDRMARQSCLIKAVVDQANPVTLVTRFEAIAAAGSDMVITDIPSEMLRHIVDLALKIQDQSMKRLGFTLGKNGYNYANSNFEEMRQAVADAINPPKKDPKPEKTESSEPDPSGSSNPADLGEGTQDVNDACAYHPVEEEQP